MSKVIPILLLICLTTVLLSISFSVPYLLSDNNIFLKGFVNHELLATLGFIVAVTLASAASLHIELNRLEEATGNPFSRTRRSVRRSAFTLLAAFGAAIVLVIVKPLLPSPEFNQAVANSVAIILVFISLSVLYDLTATVFAIPTIKRIKEIAGEQ